MPLPYRQGALGARNDKRRWNDMNSTMTRMSMILLLAVSSLVHYAAPAKAEDARAIRAFVTNFEGGSVSVIDPQNGQVVANIKTGLKPHGVAIAPDGKAVYVSNEGDDNLVIIDPVKNGVLAKVKVGRSPNQIEVSRDGRYVFVTLNQGDAVAVVDVAQRKVAKTV